MKENNLKIQKVHCNKCLQETKHFIIAERISSGCQPANNDPHCEYEISWSTIYKMLECCGCENITMQLSLFRRTDLSPRKFLIFNSLS